MLWPVTVGCACVAVVLAFLAGLSLRKRYDASCGCVGLSKASPCSLPVLFSLAEHQLDLAQAGLELRETEGFSLRGMWGAGSCCPLVSRCPGRSPTFASKPPGLRACQQQGRPGQGSYKCIPVSQERVCRDRRSR